MTGVTRTILQRGWLKFLLKLHSDSSWGENFNSGNENYLSMSVLVQSSVSQLSLLLSNHCQITNCELDCSMFIRT